MSRISDYIDTFDLSTEYVRIFHRELNKNGNIFCPFHENTETPSAKLYENKIYCFSCRRLYGTYDLLRRYDKGRIDDILSENRIEDVTTVKQRRKVAVCDVSSVEGLFNKIKCIYDEHKKINSVQGRSDA